MPGVHGDTNPSIEALVARIRALEEHVENLTAPRLGRSSFTGTIQEYDQAGNLVGRVGVNEDGTHGATTLGGPIPPIPSAPTGETTLGGLTVSWNGTYANQEGFLTNPPVAPLDWLRVDVEVSTASNFATSYIRGSFASAAGGSVFIPWATAGQQLYYRLITRTTAGKFSAPSASGGPTATGVVNVGDLGYDPNDYGGGNTIYFGSSTPTVPPVGHTTGDLWLKQTGTSTGGSGQPPAGTPLYETYRWSGSAWVLIEVGGISSALASAIAAQQAADAKAKIFYQASAPTYTGAANTAVWFETDQGNKAWSWDGSAWVVRQLGNGSIQPNSLTASNVLVTGTVTAALLEAILVLATRIVAGPVASEHAEMSSTGFTLYALDPDGDLVEAGKFGSGGADRFVLYQNGRAVLNLGNDGHISCSGLDVEGDLTIGGDFFQHILENQSVSTNLKRAGVIASPAATTTAAGVYDVEFLAVPGRQYHIHTTTLNMAPGSTSTYGFVQLRSTESSFGAPTPSSGVVLDEARGSTNLTGGVVPITLSRMASIEELCSPPAPTVPTLVRVLLVYGVISGGGNLTIFSTANNPIHTYIDDVGTENPYTGVLNLGGGTTAPPVVTNTLTVASTWVANWQSTSTSLRTGESEGIQGYTPYYPAPGSGVAQIGFPDVTATLAGATINWMRVYMYATHWHFDSGGTALIGSHQYTSVPGTRPADWQLNLMQSAGWPKPGGRWIYIPSSWFGGWASGANRGFTLGDLASTSSQYYGRFAADPSDSRRPVLEINYTK